MLDTRELGRRPGSQREVTLTVPAPADLGIEVLRVPEGAPVELDLRLEAVMEGVLVTGSARAGLSGECVRCLEPISDDDRGDVPGAVRLRRRPGRSSEEDDEVSRLEGDLLDLEPLLRDAVVLALPFQPLCRDDCPGLCTECGARLADDPDHAHEAADRPAVGERWPTLQQDPEQDDLSQTQLRRRPMAVPKRKMSRSNTRHRRSQWKAVAPLPGDLRQPGLRCQAPAAPRVRRVRPVRRPLRPSSGSLTRT